MMSKTNQSAIIWLLATLQMLGMALLPVRLICLKADGSSHIELFDDQCWGTDRPDLDASYDSFQVHNLSESCHSVECVDDTLYLSFAIRHGLSDGQSRDLSLPAVPSPLLSFLADDMDAVHANRTFAPVLVDAGPPRQTDAAQRSIVLIL